MQVVQKWFGELQCYKLLSPDVVVVQVWNYDVIQLQEMVVGGQMGMVMLELEDEDALVVVGRVVVVEVVEVGEELDELGEVEREQRELDVEVESQETLEASDFWFAPMLDVDWSFQYHPKRYKCSLPSITGVLFAAFR